MKGKRYLIMGLVGILVLGLGLSIKAEELYEEWVACYNGPFGYYDTPRALLLDGTGNVCITGFAELYCYPDCFTGDYATIKYAPNGDTLWVRRYNLLGQAYDDASALGVDASGNIYVTGTSWAGASLDFASVKYLPNGDTGWVRRYNGPADSEDFAAALAVDGNGNVYIAGTVDRICEWFVCSAGDYATIKYAPNGDTLWVRRYNGLGDSSDNAKALALDDSGNVYVTGESYGMGTNYDYATIKYAPNGDTVWVRRYNGPANGHDCAIALVVDANHDIYVTGYSDGGISKYDFTTIKYAPNGDTLSVWRYNGPGNVDDGTSALALDDSGNVYVTGNSGGSGVYADYATIKYTPNGDTVWVRRYNGLGNRWDQATSLAVDDSGNVYVTGKSYGAGNDFDYATIKYARNGDMVWVKRYNGLGNGEDKAVVLAADDSGHIYVTGESYRSGTWGDYATIKYSPCTPFSPKAGDANADDSLSLADVISAVNYYFGKTHPSPCDPNLFDCRVSQRICRFDWNGDGKVSLGDCIRGINYLFNKPGGPWAPVASLGCCPFPQ